MRAQLIGRFIAQVGLRLAFHIPRRRALLIGIRSGLHRKRSDTSETEASGTSAVTLYGPHDDVNALKALLILHGYKAADVVVLMDDPAVEVDFQPTYANIMRELDNFMVDQGTGDIFFFGYSGHSYHKKHAAGIAPTSSDKFIIPSDAGDCINSPPDYSKVIVAQVLKDKLVKRLIPGSRLIAVLDTCHSASLLDLKHCKCNRIGSWKSLLRRSVRWTRELFQAENVYTPSHGPVLPRSGTGISSMLSDRLKEQLEYCSGYCPRPWTPGPIPILCISACKDSQVAYEDTEGKSLMRTFINVLNEYPQPSLARLMRACRLKSKDVADQIHEENCLPWHPQLSSLAPLNMRALISL